MALQKNTLNINFAQGLDTKSDPFQVSPGKFLALENTVFNKGGRLQKRNGYGALTPLPDNSSTILTTFNGNLTAIGTSLRAYSESSNTWVDKGVIQPVTLDTLALIRSNTNQSQVDAVIAPNGLVCTVYTDEVPIMGIVTPTYKYAIADSVTGQNIVAPTVIPNDSSSSPRVFLLANFFIIVFTHFVAGNYRLQYTAISSANPLNVVSNVDIAANYAPSTHVNFDGFVANNNLYLAWNSTVGGQSVKMRYLTSTLGLSNTVSFAGEIATHMSVTADTSGNTPVIYVSYYDDASNVARRLIVNHALATIQAPATLVTNPNIVNITSVANSGVAQIYLENQNAYSGTNYSNFIQTLQIAQTGSIGSITTLVRSVGLASKAFLVNDVPYFLAIYGTYSQYNSSQPTYFLINSDGNVVCKLAYGNGGSYYSTNLPNVTVTGNIAQIPYFFKDLVQSINKSIGADISAGIYTQTGINLATFTSTTSDIVTSEIGKDLLISGGFLWQYDGYSPVEQGFHVWPDFITATPSGTGGTITAGEYFYTATYEWADNQGNIYRSAPSIPVSCTTSGSTSSVTVVVDTLRLTYKTANPVKIVIYRSSVAQPTQYQVTSITNPLLNDTAVDTVSFLDTLPDDDIIGNNILYTTGGVIENIAAPAVSSMTLFQSRLFIVDAEDRNLLWFSKQVIEATPVEMSDLLTIYVAPTTGAQGSTGNITALSSLDDKLIVFKPDAIYYINGSGPDNTGNNNQYSDPVFITATVGCMNQQSIVFMPQGLMFQSDKGIWLLGRDLQTTYIGAPVEDFTASATVLSAVNVPGTNQVRFTLSSGITLMYDYYYGQWGTFKNVPAVSSTLYQNLHTYINSFGQAFQETEGSYLDGSSPVLISFTTSWFNLAGLQGLERSYFFYLLGNYISPHKLSVGISYDYNDAITQQVLISPDNYNAAYGGDPIYGSPSPYGGNPTLEQWRVFLQQQKCQSFQITLNELFDSTISAAPAGAGLTLSGIALVVGAKKTYNTLKPTRSVG